MSDKKKMIVAVISFMLLIIMVGTTYSFFNYTRTGEANTVRTGRISFNSSQNGNINLTNVFPIDPTETGIMDDTTKVGTVTITVTGDTEYNKGIEYLISATNVTNTVGTGANQKTIPISINVTASGTLGTSDEDYFENRETASNHIYKVLSKDDIINDDQLMVGYIKNGTTGINGTITIKAYIDENNIAISDTYDGTESGTMGTTTNWVNGRTVVTREEWRSLSSTGISFQIKVEANEGIWIVERDRNDMANIYLDNILTSSQRSSIKEIKFIKMSEEEINTHANLIDFTATGGKGTVKGWIDDTKLYIASPGTIYFPQNSSKMFMSFSNVRDIVFKNINTGEVTNMTSMFYGCRSLTTLDLISFDTSEVTNMSGMFGYCESLTTLNLLSFDTSKVTNMSWMFGQCNSFSSIDLSIFNTSSVTDMNNMFNSCTNLTSINLSGLGSDNLSNIQDIFENCSSLVNVNMSNFNFGNITTLFFKNSNYDYYSLFNDVETVNLHGAKASSSTILEKMFYECFNLKSVDLSDFEASNVTSMFSMFSYCIKLESVNFANFDTSNVTNMSGMFASCYQLLSLDLSSFNTNSVTVMAGMFNKCTNLTTIYVSNLWNVSNVTSSNIMFEDCTSLKGGGTPQTTYDSSHVDKIYARIDGGANSSTPGYLTLKTS